ncbi:MAG: anti-sigma factor [Bacteroidota bacterium]
MKEQEKILNSGVLEQYVLGLLEREEAAKVEDYLEKYPELKTHVEQVQEVMEKVLLQNGIEPPPHVKEQILSSIDELGQKKRTAPKTTKTQKRRFRLMPILSAMAVVALVLVSFSFLQKYYATSNAYRQLEEKYEVLEKSCEINQAIVAAEREFLMKANTLPIALRGSENTKAPDAHVIVHFNKEEQAALLNVINLPEPPSNKQYQLWANVEDEMISMGVFDGTSLDLQTVDFVENATSLNITLEPFGGSEEATVEQLQASGKV